MSGHLSRRQSLDGGRTDILAIVTAGLAGGLAFGAILYALGLLDSVGRLLGAPDMLIGTILLGLASVVGGFAYLGLGKIRMFEDDVTDPITGTTMGVMFGLFVWLVGIVVVLPLWLRLFEYSPPFPFVHWQSLLGLLVYGGFVGTLYPRVSARLGR
ncbi:hypothetical protein [Natronosalvus caseinilyticus]|uniref:hypothetical protein n=1 Tax=Natronosalvus caseinilyticus TaxID=2953747 RepID=UPI0028A59FA1|nr:hypothetical protein [Natronosalvus caseinilyticus]